MNPKSRGKTGRGSAAKVGGDGAVVDVSTQTVAPTAPVEQPPAEPTKSDPLAEFFIGDAEVEAATVGGGEAFVPQESRTGTMAELLAFWAADEEYAIDIVQIQEIIKLPAITEVPRAPVGVLGIISLRGTIVPIVDLRIVLHLDPTPPSNQSRVLVLRGDGDPLGVLVDRVSSVVRIDRESIEAVPRTMQRDMTELLAGVGRIGERMLIVLELSALLNMTESGR